MKSKLIVAALLIGAAVMSCKKDETKKEEAPVAAPVEAVQPYFSVEINVTSEKPEDLAVYFTEDGSINFNAEHAVWRPIKGDNVEEKALFNFSEEIVPTTIRLDFGLKKGADQGNVTVSSIKFMNHGKSFEIKGADFFKFFAQNESIKTEVDQAKGTITFLKDPKSTITPFFYPQPTLVDEIAKITK